MAKGNTRNAIKKVSSKKSSRTNKSRSAVINKVLKTIPINMENLTKPCLYSFFHGLKNVLIIKESENALKKDLLRFKK